MNREYLEDLVFKIERDFSYDGSKMQEYRIKATEALKILFPKDPVFVGEFSRIEFDHWGSRNEVIFKNGRTKMLSMLKAKVDLLKLEERQAKELDEDNGVKLIKLMGALKKSRGEADMYRMECQRLGGEVKKLEKENEDFRKLLDGSLESNDLLRGNVDRLESRDSWKNFRNGTIWTVIGILLATSTFIAHNQGVNKSEYTVSSLTAENQQLKIKVDSLEKKIVRQPSAREN